MKHGYARKKCTRTEHVIWHGMKQRCYNPKNRMYHRYGGRGIRVCDRWRHSFVNFISDMGDRPSRDHSLDRIDNNGNYEPGNCRWATTEQQIENSNAKWFKPKPIEFRGLVLSMKEWSVRTGICKNTLKARLFDGWTVEDTLTKPLNKSCSRVRK